MRARSIAEICFPSLDLTRPAAEQIFNGLRGAILSMDLVPGSLLSETEIGLRFGASRTPVRAALTQLRNEGLVVTWPSRGNYVAKLSEQNLRAAQFIRESLEVSIVKRLAETGLDKECGDRLEQILIRQKAALDRAREIDFHTEDEAFHNALAAATGMPQVHALLIREKANLDRLRQLGIDDAAHRSRLYRDHRQILDAVKAGDVTTAQAVMEAHTRCISGKIAKLKEANEDFFE